MTSFPSLNSLWDLSQGSAFSQLPDDDFLALIQKQFSSPINDPNGMLPGGVDPQNTQQLPLPNLTPPSDDSSPSPQSANTDSLSRRQSVHFRNDAEDSLKRKVSYDDDDMDEGPSSKNQHIDITAQKKGSIGPTRRKSTGTSQDESRLLKRKEQNRAAQRAFRERKEKHVKDLEDKVAALEEKNEQAQAENENLRDLLSRLQNENIALKEATFTFTMPKPGESSNAQASSPSSSSGPPQSPFNLFTTTRSSPPAIPPAQSPKSMSLGDLDWNSLTTFDPSMLTLLDENPQQNTTDTSMAMDISGSGIGQYSLPPRTHYTTLATNPLFMSFADVDGSNPENVQNPFNFNFQSNWPLPPQRDAPEHSLDDLFGGNYVGPQGPLDFNALLKSPPGLSPITHINGHSPMSQMMSSPSSNSTTNNSQSPYSWTVSRPADTPPSTTGSDNEPPTQSNDQCPLTKADFAKQVKDAGDSPFATSSPPPTLHKANDMSQGNMIACKGANFPMVEENEHNIEVLSAWRRITSDPQFKDVDINQLCTEFTKKAKCDGTKVVLDPQGVHHILETMNSRQQSSPQQQA